jgi:hypothetical protein
VARLRVRAAAEQLSGTGTPIAAIAYEHGTRVRVVVSRRMSADRR